ncbi:hypothetical protein BH09MYX1_BH09MYX1_05640 [soil metagenome]
MRTARLGLASLVGLVVAALACGSDPAIAPELAQIGTGDVRFVVHANGSFDVLRKGRVLFDRAFADALVDDGSGPRAVTLDCAPTLSDQSEGHVVLTCTVDGVALALDLRVSDHLEVSLAITNPGSGTLVVLRASPLVADRAHGSIIHLGKSPATHRILEDGRFIAFDQTAQITLGDAAPFPLAFALPIPVRGNSASNWTHAVVDMDDRSNALAAGYLSFERSVPTLGIGATDDAFAIYAADSAFVFHGKRLAPGASTASERLWLEPFPADPLAALERYATRLAEALAIRPWVARGGGRTIPSGWNSWSGGGGTGGYGQAIDQGIVDGALDRFAKDLAPWGNRYFQIDDGWQLRTGDWTWNQAKFSDDGASWNPKIAARGMKGGVWMAPFAAPLGSEVAKAHPEWLAPAEDGLVGAFGKQGEIFDLSRPEVVDHLRALGNQLRTEGWGWAKLDFTYYALLGKMSDGSRTNVEWFRDAWKAIREALGPDVFVVGIGLPGLLAGIVDGMRTTLDDGPKWDEDSADDFNTSPRALKGAVRTASRRWFFGGRVWASHPDLIFFRSWPASDPAVPALAFEEAKTFATFVGMTGGIVKVGDKDTDLDEPRLDVVRRLLPPWPGVARPLDVLERDYPERFHETVVAPAGTWDVFGLFHWGTNRDLTKTPLLALGEAPRPHPITCSTTCVAYEFWTESYLGSFSGSLDVAVPPRTARVVAVREIEPHPQLLGTNRHLLQGANDLGALTWSEETRRLDSRRRRGALRVSPRLSRSGGLHRIEDRSPRREPDEHTRG